jgi:hypothetical protein
MTEDTMVDKRGVPIFPGDILQNKDPTSPWQFFVCFRPSTCEDEIEVRDLNNNNLGMCELGIGGDVVNIGHFSLHLDILNNDDLRYYFGIDLCLAEANNCKVTIGKVDLCK